MNNTLLLMKANIINSWGINKVLKSKSTGEKVKAGLVALAMVYAVVAIMASMFFLNYPLAKVLKSLNALELMISASILQTTLFALITSIYKVPGYLFAFRDYDMLMALPVKASAILTSKMIFVYLSNLGVSIVIGSPPLIVYGWLTSGGPVYYLFVALTTFFIPLIPISIGALFAYILGRITSKFRATNIILMVGSFLILIAVMIGSTMVGQVRTEQIQNSIPTVQTLNDVLFWTKWYIHAIKDMDILYLMYFILGSVLVFGIFIGIFSKGFKSINAKMTEKFKASKYKMTVLKVSSPIKALFMKELRFYFSSYIYVLNTAFGVVMMTLFSLGVAIFGKDTVAKMLEIPMADAFLGPIITAVFVFCISFTFTTAASISLEGKNLWIMKSLPVKTENILWAKILLNMALTVPALIINTVIVAIAFKMAPVSVLAIFCTSLLYCVLSPVLGILINLYFPKLEWTTHVAVVKQSASVLMATLAGFITLGIPVVLFALLQPSDSNIFLGAVSLALIAVNIILIKVLNTLGVRKFNEL